MARYEFTLTLSGEGENEDEAWLDAVEAFGCDPGTPPNPGVVVAHDFTAQEYAAAVARGYIHKGWNALEAYKEVYGQSHPQDNYEADLAWILRCAEQDFYDGSVFGAIFQDVYDALERGDYDES